MPIINYSRTAASNNSSPPNGAPEGMAPGAVNNVIREVMADIREGVDYTTNTVATMTALDKDLLVNNDVIKTRGYAAIGDGGGGLYYWNSSSTATAAQGTVIASDEGGNGRFIRVAEDVLFLEAFGAVGDGSTDDTVAIQAAIDSGLAFRGNGSTYAITESLTMGDGSTLKDVKLVMTGSRGDYTIAAVINENYNDSTGNTNITVENVEITGFSDVQQTDGTTITSSNIGIAGVYFQYIAGARIKNVKTTNTGSGVTIYLPPSGTESAEARNLVEDCYILRAQGYYQTGNSGTPRGVYFGTGGMLRNNYAEACATGYYIEAEGTRVIENEAHDWYKDDGFYLVGTRLIVSGNRAVGTLGNGYAIAYNRDSIVTDNYTYGATNMGFRIHAPQSNTTIANNIAEYCGYGARIENSVTIAISSITRSSTTVTVTTTAPHSLLTGRFVVMTGGNESGYRGVYPVIKTGDSTFTYEVSGSPTSPGTGTYVGYYTSQGLNLTDNQFNNNDSCGIQLSYLVNSVVKGNRCFENNQDGVGVGTRGGLSVGAYCLNNEFSNNKCYDYQATPTQTFGFYNYAVATSGAVVENSGNWVEHQSQTGTDSFGVEPAHGLRGTGSPESAVEAAPGSSYTNLSGGTSTTLYVKESGTGNTGWVAK